MANLLQKGVSWLTDRLKTSAATAVEYETQGVRHALTAAAGRTEFNIADESGALFTLTTADWIFKPADLAAIGVTKPARGDRVHVTRGDAAEEYEILSRDGTQPYRFDAHEQLIRVHTLQVKKTT